MFGVEQCGWVRAVIVRLPFPYYSWLEQPFQEDVRWGRVALSADTGEDIRRLIFFPEPHGGIQAPRTELTF